MPGSVDLEQSQDQHVWTVFDGVAEELFDLFILAHLSQPKQGLYQIQTFPERDKDVSDNTHTDQSQT